MALRIRLFHDDLQAALRTFAGRPNIMLTEGDRADSLFGAYFARSVRLDLDGRLVALHVTASAAEPDEVAGMVVWYVLEGEVPAEPARLTMLNAILFETFDDQQNIVQLLRLPKEERRTLYFNAREPKPQELHF